MSRSALAVALALSMGAGASARAQGPAEPAPPRWGFEIRSGPYQPRVGNSFERTYYDRFYARKGTGVFEGRPFMTELELDYYAVNSIGLLGPMLHVGFWSVTGKTYACNDSTSQPVLCTATEIVNRAKSNGTIGDGNDTTTLAVFPLGLGLVYRFDLLKRATGFPLVPYVKGSVDYYIWRNTGGGGVSRYNGHKAEGGTLGVRGTAGVALNLDFIEPSTASRARISTGLTDTYLFADASNIWANNFGSKKRLDLSAILVQVGLAVDFE